MNRRQHPNQPTSTPATPTIRMEDHPLGKVLVELTRPFVDTFRQAYIESGSPLGDTEEGFTAWLRLLAESIPDYRR